MSSTGANPVIPRSPTRSWQRMNLVEIAHSARLSSCIRIPHVEGLEMFVNLASINPDIGTAVEILLITLPSDVGYPAQLLRRCLALTPNIDTLVLYLPHPSPANLVIGFVFPCLIVLSTNLPHATLRPLLVNNPSITSLAIQSCGSHSRCPLRDVNLSRVTDLQCPARCLEGIARGQVETATVNLTRMTSVAALALRALSTSPIHSLTVDFFSDDCDILARIAASAPHLRKLKLVEKPRNLRRFLHMRRPWNDLRVWHATLLRLPSLEEFLLRTSVSVVGPRRSEADVVTTWANGARNHETRHPSLYHIALLQHNAAPNTNRLSHWFKSGGVWEHVSNNVVGHTHSFVL